MRKRFGIDTAP